MKTMKSLTTILLAACFLFPSPAKCQEVAFSPDPMISFAHFLIGIAEVFPTGNSFNRKVFAYRRGSDARDRAHVEKIASFVRGLSKTSPVLRDFELKFYRSALGKSSASAFFRALCQAFHKQAGKDVRFDFFHLYVAFRLSMGGNPDLVEKVLGDVARTKEYGVFLDCLGKIRGFFGVPRNTLPLRVVPVFLHARSSEIPKLKSLGITGVFGLNLEDLQIVELALVEGRPELTLGGLRHLYAVTLHEICHFFFYRSEDCHRWFGKEAIPQEKQRHLIAEGIAAALGNGVFQTAVRNDDPQWYSDREINSFAHRLFPHLVEFLQKGFPLDAPFAERVKSLSAQGRPEPTGQEDPETFPGNHFRYEIDFPDPED